ncbi:MAG: UDP-glucose/GDP-mannose dehydrogenase family protein [Candidatus Tectomicrobia bacterium]|uniref:UDP-glucose 6-dehydrogenase n=1 Tax=Tectimicrobiota bacterium TaxID=2528274 RepID=A0A933LPL8_UNCTE|nr:UDP-glucose/GDP-mannose dehydrogenase family protein [Candidatus Tectomicrobia bacterium]
MNISVIGTGYVGLVTGACFADFGIHVTCIDKDQNKLKLLTEGHVPIYEPGLKELIQKNVQQGRMVFTSDIVYAIQNALVIFIAVGTPSKEDGSADLTYIDEVAYSIAENIDGYKVIVTKSTVPVGTAERIRQIILSKLKDKVDFDVVSNPEFLREGSAIEDFMRPNRVVIGCSSDQAKAIMRDLFRPLYLLETPFIITDLATAEMIKLASNSFLAAKISFINEIANICEVVGANVNDVAKGMGLDQRIGSKFLHPGPGFGGSCFPKDTKAILQMAAEKGYRFQIVESVLKVNEMQQDLAFEKIKKALDNQLENKTLAILGLSFKPNTNDLREAPAVNIISRLLAAGAKIKAYDPAAMEEAKIIFDKISYCGDAYEAAKEADALVLITEWNQFRNLDLHRLKELLKTPVFIDLRNVYETARMRESGFIYTSIGRT